MDIDPALGGEGRGRYIMKMRPIHSFVPIQAGSLFISSSSSNGFFQKSAKKGRLFLIENEASEKNSALQSRFPVKFQKLQKFWGAKVMRHIVRRGERAYETLGKTCSKNSFPV